jgi:N-acetyl-alpha-D-muramate 1-phosphate uridylyltransferase
VTFAPRSAMVLAAGLGTRLRPVTDILPKPLIEINGRTLLDHAIDRLVLAGIEQIVVNTHYKAGMIADQLAKRDHPHIEISHEGELLDTGGGVARALSWLEEAFFVVNADVFWLEGKEPALLRLARTFDPGRMDAILMLHRAVTAIGYDGDGDYFLAPDGQPRRRREREVAPFVYAGLQLLHRRLFDGISQRLFSLVRLYDRAETAGRLHAIVHDGEWFHIGTPTGLAATRARLSLHGTER